MSTTRRAPPVCKIGFFLLPCESWQAACTRSSPGKRDGLELGRDEIAFVISGYVKGDIPDYQVAAWLMAIYIRGLSDRELADLTGIMLDSGDRIPLDAVAGQEDRQAQHRRRRRQGQLRRRPAPGRLRRARAHALRPRPRPHRRHPGQAGGHPGHERLSPAGAVPQRAGRNRHGHLRPDRQHRAGRQEALRPARRHRHRQLHPAHRLLDHEQEAGPGLRRHRARRQDRQRRLHEGGAGLHPPVPHHGRPSAKRPAAPPWASSRTWTAPSAAPWATAWR